MPVISKTLIKAIRSYGYFGRYNFIWYARHAIDNLDMSSYKDLALAVVTPQETETWRSTCRRWNILNILGNRRNHLIQPRLVNPKSTIPVCF
jgi:hypothetical protein